MRCARGTFVAGVLLVTASCTPPVLLDRMAVLDVRPVRVSVRYQAADAPSAALVEHAVGPALDKLAPWGDFQAPVEIDVVPSHGALEQVVHRSGYGWLRAWARYRDVIVQSPRTWAPEGGSPEQIGELLTHELTHCLMYQLAAGESEWPYKQIPAWFREGMASVVAGQGYRRGSLAQVGEAVTHGLDPLGDADALYRDRSDLVYAAAHQAFAMLVERGGVGHVRELLGVLRSGLTFDPAFQQVYGESRRDFEKGVLAQARQRFEHPPAP